MSNPANPVNPVNPVKPVNPEPCIPPESKLISNGWFWSTLVLSIILLIIIVVFAIMVYKRRMTINLTSIA
jgi:hypothetical protein